MTLFEGEPGGNDITTFRSHLTEQDYLDGQIGAVPQKIGMELVTNVTQFTTIADDDHEMFYWDKKAKIWRPNGENFIWKYCASKYPAISKFMLKETVHYMQGQTLIPREKFVPPEGWLSFKNTSLNSLFNYREEFDTYSDNIKNRFPVNYNPKAVCPLFSKFLNEVIPDFEDRFTLLESLAMLLIPHVNFEKSIMFIGTTAANGKSTIMNVMRKLFGVDNTISISLQDLIYSRFMSQQLDNKLINIYADINADKIKDLDRFKLFVSGDRITVERKNGHPYLIKPKTIHFFSTNTLPEIEEDNNAVYRRWVIIEFPNSFIGKEDRKLFEKLSTPEELEGIMSYLVKIAKSLVKRDRFLYEQSPTDIRLRWKEQSNAVFELIERSGMINKKPDRRITRQEFYTAYIKFCKEKHYTIKTMNTVTRQVEKLGYESQKSGNNRFWLGLSVPQISEGQKVLPGKREDVED